MSEQQKLISESTTFREMDERLKAFRQRLYGRSPDEAESNGHYLAWCDGVEFGMKQSLRILGMG